MGIKSIIDYLLAFEKDCRYQNRINPILKIMTNNEDPDTQSSEDFN
jgi:hypothetical protein